MKYYEHFDNEDTPLRVLFNSFVEDDGWNPPKEVFEEFIFELTRTEERERQKVKDLFERHKGKWLTKTAAKEYCRSAWLYLQIYRNQYIREVRHLGERLQREYGVTELEAVNILAGNEELTDLYVSNYQRIKHRIPLKISERQVYDAVAVRYEEFYRRAG